MRSRCLKLQVGIGFGLTAALVGTGVAYAAPDDAGSALVQLALEGVPEGVVNPGLPLVIDEEAGKASTGASNLLVEMPGEGASAVSVTSLSADATELISIGIPNNAGGGSEQLVSNKGIAYEGEEASTVVQPFEEGLRMTTIIEDASAPTSHEYDLPDDVLPVINADGSVTLASEVAHPDFAEGEVLRLEYGTVAPAWATDANGESVPTHYEVEQGVLRQVVDLTATDAFPVIADPTYWWGWNAHLPNSVHQQVLKVLLVGGSIAAGAATLSAYIPSPHAQLAVRLAAVIAGVGIALWNACNFNGRGVIVGHTWLASGIPPLPGLTFLRSGFFCLPR